TFAYAVCGTVLSVAIGLVLGLFTSEVWWQVVAPHQPRPVWLALRGILAIPRAIHELIWGLFCVNIFGLDPLVAVLGIVIPYGAIVTKVFSELLDETPRQPLVTLVNSGVSPLTACLYTIFPQACLDLLSYSFYRFECSIRSAAVLGIIGAGGLGYEILLSLQSLRYEQLWTLFYALILLSGSVDVFSALLRRRLGSPTRLDLNWKTGHASRSSATKSEGISREQPPTLTGWLWHYSPTIAVIAAVILVPASFIYIRPDISKLWAPRTLALLVDVAKSSWPLTVTPAVLSELGMLSLQTLAMSILAIVVAGSGGMVLSFFAAHSLWLPGGLFNSHSRNNYAQWWAWPGVVSTRLVLLVCRAIPAPVWALIATFVLFPGILPGAIALGFHNLGILGRLMAEVVENLDQRPAQAIKTQGASPAVVFLYSLLPMTLTRFLAYSLYRWEVCMRETVIVGLVGAGGLGRLLTEQLSSFDYRGVSLSLICFVLLTMLVDATSAGMRRSLR
ncbi:MAG: ABC transporter permease subunit, partial [Cyanobacteria bacterium]|nr:ABC transporter permease subunit [Cyanobacteriota bacterium]MDW8202692.1 ABC transporter permease subunit [Cyanobacteriota bacterium SKYGB_h_bin112]